MTDKQEDSVTPIIIDPRMLQNTYNYDDEMSLVDLWLTLVKQKKVFFSVFLIIVGVGLIFALTQPTLYEYSTVIEIGTKADKVTLIQPIETLKSEVTSAYINQALHEYFNKNKNIIDIAVENPKGTDLLLLKSTGTKDQSDLHISIQNNILQKLISKHHATSEAIKKGLYNQRLTLSNKIEDLENEKLFASKKLEVENTLAEKQRTLSKLQENKLHLDNALARLESLHKLLQKQYKTDTNNLKSAIENQRIAAQGNPDTPLLVLLTSELQQYRTHIAALEERLSTKTPAQEEEIKLKIADNLRAQENQRIEIQQAKYAVEKLDVDRKRQLAALKTKKTILDDDINALPITHAIIPPTRSFKPTNSKLMIIAVFAVLGIFIALFAALLSGFLTNIKNDKGTYTSSST